MPSVIVAGGGLAGLAAAATLGSSGYDVDLFEARPFLGGRATSYEIPSVDGPGEVIDNCQHVLLRCCINLLDLYTRLGVSEAVQFHREFFFVEPGGRISVLRSGMLPAPLHFTESFLTLACLNLREKLALGRALLALRSEYRAGRDLSEMSMMDWLREKNQPERVIGRFWSQVLVSAVNEDLERMAAVHGFRVFFLGFLTRRDAYEMGIPKIPLGELYTSDAWRQWPNVRIHTRCPVEQIGPSGVIAGGTLRQADQYIVALPIERLSSVWPGLTVPKVEHSPITGIHLWFDRDVIRLPHATLLDRTIQWMFRKGPGQVQLVVSASRSLVLKGRPEIIKMALEELAEFFPAVREATVLKAHVVKELRATFSGSAAFEAVRRPAATQLPNVFLAGDWTRSGWPATMEGAVRSGYIAAEAVTRANGAAKKFLLADMV